jgi:outer membrane protein
MIRLLGPVFFVVAMAASLVASPAAGAPAPTPTPIPMTTPSPQASPGAQVLTLKDAETIALASSPLLELARAALDQARAGVTTARSGALPNLSASASSDRSKGGSRGGTGSTTTGGSSWFTSTSANLSFKQLLFDGGRVFAQISAARASTDAQVLLLQRQVETVEFTVAQQYYAALQARHQYQVAQKQRDNAVTQEKLVEGQFRAGAASKADVLTAQLPVAQADLALAQAQNGEQSQIAVLLNAMGLPSNAPVQLTDDSTPPGPGKALDALLAIAATSRADLAAARASERASADSVRSAQLARIPVLSGTASTGVSTTGQNANGTTATGGGVFGNSSSFGVGLTFPIFDGGLIAGQTASAQAQQRSARANLRSTELAVTLTVTQAYLAYQSAVAGVSAAQVELSQAQTVLDVTNAQYKSGVTTLPLLLSAQTGLIKAENDYVNALYTAKTAEQQVLFSAGLIGNF